MINIKRFFVKLYFQFGTVLLFESLLLPVFAQDSTTTPYQPVQNSLCSPKVFFVKGKESIKLCLDNFMPLDDSCGLVNFKVMKYGINVTFNFTMDKHWVVTNTTVDSNANVKSVFNASVSYDNEGILTEAVFNIDAPSDSSRMELEHSKDIISNTDTAQQFDYEISRSSFICNEKIIYGKLVIREYVYPAGYGEKGQILNYPELSAFHHGGSVKMPTGGGAMQVRAFTMNYWHIQEPLPIEYDDLEEIRKYEAYLAKWRARHPPREKKVRQRKPFLSLKAL